MSNIYVFYGRQLYGEYIELPRYADIPDGCYIYAPKDREKKYWYLKDLTPVLLEDVPKPIRALVLLMGLS